LFILFGLKVLQSPESSWRLASKGPFAPNDRPAIESSMAPDDERMGFNLCAEGEKFLPGTSSSGFSLRGYSTTALGTRFDVCCCGKSLARASRVVSRATKADKGITVRAAGRYGFFSPAA